MSERWWGGNCDAAIRPFPNDTEVRCDGEHVGPYHGGDLLDYAYPGSKTRMTWDEYDRRTFHGEWPGPCDQRRRAIPCVLPRGHRGEHAW